MEGRVGYVREGFEVGREELEGRTFVDEDV